MLPVAREAVWLVYILIAATAVAFAFSMQWVGAILVVLVLACVFLLRNFRRSVPPLPLSCLSPVDGVVVEVTKTTDPYLSRPTVCYEIRQSYLGEFNLYCPVEGKIERLWVRDPQDKNIDVLAFCIITDEGDSILTRVDLQSHLRHATTSLQPGERIGQGQRCGFAGIGCRVNVYLPANVIQTAHPGDSVRAGVDILATLVRV